MPTVYALLPDAKLHWQVSSDGSPASGYKLFVYEAGTTTKATSYRDSDGLVTNTNPVVLNSRGEPPHGLYVETGTYKLVLAPDTDTDPPSSAIWTRDDITPINDVQGVDADEWTASELTPTYVSASSFTLVGDQTTEFHVGRRIRITDSGGTDYGIITASSYSDPNTTVTVSLDSGSIDSGISAVAYSFLSADNSALPHVETDSDGLIILGDLYIEGGALRLTQGADVASASALDVSGDGNLFDVTGTTAITSIASKGVGSRITLQFDAALTLTHHATDLVLPGGVDIVTGAGDVAELYEYAAGDWRLINFQSAWGKEWYTQYIDFTNGDADDTGAWTFDLPGVSGDSYRLLLHGISADTAGWFPSLRFRRVGDGSVHTGSSYLASYGAVGGAGSNNNTATRIDLIHTTAAANDIYQSLDIQIYAPHGPGNAGANTPVTSVIWNGVYHDVGTGVMRTFGAGVLNVSNNGVDQVQVYLGNGSGNFDGGHGMLTRHRDIFG